LTRESEHDAIVVAVDASNPSDAAISWAARDAAMRGVALKLVHVIEPGLTNSPSTASHGQLDVAHRVLCRAAAIAEKAAGHVLDELHTEMQSAPAVSGLVDESRQAEMIVVGGRRKDGVIRGRLGSINLGLLGRARCPVVVVHQGGHLEHNIRGDAPVLVGIDGSPASETATGIAFDEASRRGGPLVALHSWSDVGLFPVLGTDWQKQRDNGHDLLTERIALPDSASAAPIANHSLPLSAARLSAGIARSSSGYVSSRSPRTPSVEGTDAFCDLPQSRRCPRRHRVNL